MTTIGRRLRFLTAIAVVAIALATGSGWALGNRHAAAYDGRGDRFYAFGVVGLARGQTARLHVITVGIPDTIPVELTIHDRSGHVLADSGTRLLAGQVVTLDLPFVEPPGAALSRLEIYAVVRLPAVRLRGQGYVIPTLEVVEADGRTGVLLVNPEG